MALGHEPSREGMAPVSGVSAKLSASSEAYKLMDPGGTPGAGMEHKEPIVKEFSCSIFLNFIFYYGKIFKYKSKRLL